MRFFDFSDPRQRFGDSHKKKHKKSSVTTKKAVSRFKIYWVLFFSTKNFFWLVNKALVFALLGD